MGKITQAFVDKFESGKPPPLFDFEPAVNRDDLGLAEILGRLRAIRDSSSGEVRAALNLACDRIDVAISKIMNENGAE